jgi:hypothetical protein
MPKMMCSERLNNFASQARRYQIQSSDAMNLRVCRKNIFRREESGAISLVLTGTAANPEVHF